MYLFLVTSSFGFLQPFLPLYMEAAGLSKSQIGLLTGLGMGIALLVQPLLGRLSDRLDVRRPFIALSALGAAAAYFSFPLAHSLPEFLILVALGANGTMYLNTAGGVLVGRMVQATRGGAAYANLRVWGSVGYIVTSLLTGWLLDFRGHGSTSRTALNEVFRYGPLLFVGIAAIAWLLPDRKSEQTSQERPGRAPLPANLKRFLVAYFLYSFALYGASSFLSIYLKDLGADGRWITGTFAAGVVVEVLVMRWSGRLSDRFGRRPALAVSFLLLPVRLLLYAPATGPLWVLLVQSLHGVNFGIVGAVAVAFSNDLATERTRGHAQARLATVAGLAMAIAPPILGKFADYAGLPAMFIFSAVIAAAGAAVLLFTVEDSHPTSESIAARGPALLRPFLRWLDNPPRRVR